MTAPGRVLMISLGCAKNLVDSEQVLGGLVEAGWQVVDHDDQADLIVVNTCAFIQPAVEESVEKILQAAAVKGQRPVRLVVLGCLVQRFGRKLPRLIPEVDHWLGPGVFSHLEGLVRGETGDTIELDRPTYLRRATDPRTLTTGPGWAYLKVAEGCDHGCTFCLIPKLRGPFRSRSVADLTAEAEVLVRGGVRELVLVAQDTSRFGLDNNENLTQLIDALDRIPDLAWVRILYLHPDQVTENLIQAVARSRTMVPYFDLPIQHASPKILKAMGRRRGPDDISALIESIRRQIPQAVLRTTVMVGFPGETEDDFNQLLEFIQREKFDHLGGFTYCPEAGTRAARFKDRPHRAEAQARLDEIMAVQAEISRAKLSQWQGRQVEVLVEGTHPESDLLWSGRTWFMAPEVDGQVIITDGPARPGFLLKTLITRTHDFDLEGVVVSGDG
jgi:ribosomal protein S12 methylthiotransferase